jgi:hypothetical protein
MLSFKELKQLKIKTDFLNRQVKKFFLSLSGSCEYRKLKHHDSGDWYKCTHKNYHLAKYRDITPCDEKECPKLN